MSYMVFGGEIRKEITSEMLIKKMSNPKNSELKKNKVQELNNFLLLKPIELEPFHRHIQKQAILPPTSNQKQ